MDVVLRLVEPAEHVVGGADQRVVASLVGRELSSSVSVRDSRRRRGATYIPEEGACETLGLHVLGLELSDVGRVVRDELALRGVVRVASDVRGVLVDGCAGQGKVLVRVNTSFNRAGTDL